MFSQVNNNFIVPWEISLIITLYIIGTFITRWYAKEKRWSSSLTKALIVQIPWLFISILSILTLFFPVNEILSFFIPYIKIAIISLIGMIVASRIYEKDLVVAALFTIPIQIILFVMTNLFELLYYLILRFLEIAQIENKQSFGGIIMYFVSLFVVLGDRKSVV